MSAPLSYLQMLRLFISVLLLGLAGACATTPPKPAMAPLGLNGPFGYSDRAIVDDLTTITYTGAYVPVSPADPRNDSRMQAEYNKTHDLALWRAAQLGQQQGYAAIRVESEQRDSDVEVRDTPIYTPAPNYAYYRCWRDCFANPWWFNDGYYTTQRTARARAVIRLNVRYARQFNPDVKGSLSIASLLTQMQTTWGSATYASY